MIKIKAHIKLFVGKEKRKTPFYTGYRPLFSFNESTKTSGKITLMNQEEFYPGEDGIVEITFLHKEFLGKDFKKGKTFYYYEAEEPLGEGEILELI